MLYCSAVKSIFLNQTIFEYVSSKTYQWKNQLFHFIDKNLNTTDFILVAYVYNTRIPFINTFVYIATKLQLPADTYVHVYSF